MNGRAVNGIKEVEYGFYPKSVVDERTQNILNQQLNSGRLKKTGNSYTTNSAMYDANGRFQYPNYVENEEYEYNGRRYVRVEAVLEPYFKDMGYNGGCYITRCTLSNGRGYIDGDYVWVEVEPVKWLVDEQAKIMITKDIIFAGVCFNDISNYPTAEFEKTMIKWFMDEYLSKDLEQRYDKNIKKVHDEMSEMDLSEEKEKNGMKKEEDEQKKGKVSLKGIMDAIKNRLRENNK